MRKYFLILIGLLMLGCGRDETATIVKDPDVTYSVEHFDISYLLPAGWSIVQENARFLIIVPADGVLWEPGSPQDIAKNPQVRFDYGKNIRDRLGPHNFPETINESDLLNWLKEQTASGVFRDLEEKRIANYSAVAVTEIRPPDCERVIYWRMKSMETLIRLATGCESPFLSDFYRIVDSLQDLR